MRHVEQAEIRSVGARRVRAFVLALALGLSLSACSSLSVERTTKTSGTFRSRAWSFTLLTWDMPQTALGHAREMAADTRLVNMKIERVSVTPDWGWFDWILDIISVRVATIEGTWGFSGEDGPDAGASPGSS